ncbi:hypothetical protein C1H46_000944 [Malus baccata]|uniref:Uncharacterized protein n=1 Tax=Malus baccata TaxID=106549 RepID=A0A540NQR8_MALBA|nr:hypothetical protein C1H46_000944 [Malus baccata]
MKKKFIESVIELMAEEEDGSYSYGNTKYRSRTQFSPQGYECSDFRCTANGYKPINQNLSFFLIDNPFLTHQILLIDNNRQSWVERLENATKRGLRAREGRGSCRHGLTAHGGERLRVRRRH